MQSITHKKTPQNIQPEPQSHLCLCNAIKPTLILCKITGFFPVETEHINGYCIFKKSNFWLTYSIIATVVSIVQLISVTNLHGLFNADTKSLHLVLSQINDLIYNSYLILLHILCIIRYPKFINAFNNLIPIMQEGMLCRSSLNSLKRVQYCYLGTLALVFCTQYAALAWLHYSENYKTCFEYTIFFNKFTQNLSFVFYIIFTTVCCVLIGVFGCYEKLVISCLKYKTVHPVENFEEVSFKGDFMGIFEYTICESLHPRMGKYKLMQSAELIEYLRYLHEEISQIMYEINTYLNPQMLGHLLIELAALIINWYAVVAYLAFNFTNRLAATLNFLNCIFVLFHTFGVFAYLKCGQHLHNIVKEVARFFLEYSTRVCTPDEHQQIRLLIDKIQVHKLLTASGILTVDLGMAGAICANLLTYVLVALQFNVTKS